MTQALRRVAMREWKRAAEVITYRIERGARRRLLGIAFEGNHYFSDQILRSRVRLQPARICVARTVQFATGDQRCGIAYGPV